MFENIRNNVSFFNQSGHYVVMNPMLSELSFQCLNGKFIDSNASSLNSDVEYLFSDSYLFVFSPSKQLIDIEISFDMKKFTKITSSHILHKNFVIKVNNSKDYVFMKTNKSSDEFSYSASTNS